MRKIIVALCGLLMFALPAHSECMTIAEVYAVPAAHHEYKNVRFVEKEYAGAALVLFHWMVEPPPPDWDTAMLLDETNGDVTVLVGTKTEMCGAVQVNEDDWIKLKNLIEPTKA